MLFLSIKAGLTAAGLWLPAFRHVAAVRAAGSGVGHQELTLETVHRRVFAQHVGAGGDERIWIDVVVAGGEGSLVQEITAVGR